MSESVSVAVTLQDDTLRYAELERRDQEDRLLRFGSERFPFDLTRALLREESDAQQVHQVEHALGNALRDTSAHDLRVGIHPSDSYSFFTPISSDVPVRDRKRQLLQQAALVTGVRSTRKLHMTSETVRTTQDSEGEPFIWVHVLAVPDAVDQRIEAMVDQLPVREHSWTVTSQAAARVASRIERTGGSAQEALRPYSLALGQYPAHTEYALSRNREWYHAHYAQEGHSAENRAYFAVGFLNRVNVPLDGVGRLFVYGADLELDAYRPFESIFGQEPEALDPFRVVDPPGSVPASPSAFAPCVGAAMRDYVG